MMQIVSPKPAPRQTIIPAAVDAEQMQRQTIRKDGGSVAKTEFS